MADPWEDRIDREADRFAQHPWRSAFRWWMALLAVIVVVAVTWGIVSWVGSWGGTAKRLTGPAHSEQQVTAVLNDWTSMQAAAANVCQVRDSQRDRRDPTIVERPEFAYAAQYRQIKADYDRRMANFFEAAVTRHLPIPAGLRGYPREAPSLPEMERSVC